VTRLTISSGGTATFSGSLIGTSATFSGSVTAASDNYTNLFLDGTNATGWGNNIAFKSKGTAFGYVGSLGSLLGNATKDMTIYATAGNGFRVYTNGNNKRLEIDSVNGDATFSGDVGIGTDSPTAILDVRRGDADGKIAEFHNNVGYGLELGSSTSEAYINSGSLQSLAIGTNNSTKLTISSAGAATFSGNVGIGVTPSAWISSAKVLQLGNTAALFAPTNEAILSNNVYVNSSDQNIYLTDNFATEYRQVNGQHIFYTAASGTGGNTIPFSPKLTISSGGTATFSGDVTVSKSGDSGININNTANNGLGILRYQNEGSNLWGVGINITNTDDRWEVYNFGLNSSPLIISSGGNVGIGTDPNAAKLQIQHGTSSLTSGLFYNYSGSQTATTLIAKSGRADVFYHFQAFSSTSTEVFRIESNGNAKNTNNSYGSLSDIKIKENISDATPKLDDLLKVKIRNYNIIGQETKQIGIIAQELEEIFPSMVDENQDRDDLGNLLNTTTKGVKYSVFVPMLIKGMQEQQTIIEDLKARIETLEG
jgi:hypothetical protein